MGEEEKKRRVVVESLGWLTESSIMPKKHRVIEGVGASSIMELKAHLYKSQEEAKKSKDLSAPDALSVHRAKPIKIPTGPYSAKNSGVEARAHKDKLEWKAINDGAVNYAALEKKAQLYDKLVRGELSDEEDKEKYCVDFFRKNIEHDEPRPPLDQHTSVAVPPETEDGDNDASFLFNTKPLGLGRTGGTLDNDEHKRFVREVHEEANQERQKASDLKLRRQEQAAARREKLRQAYLKKRLGSLKASSNAEQT